MICRCIEIFYIMSRQQFLYFLYDSSLMVQRFLYHAHYILYYYVLICYDYEALYRKEEEEVMIIQPYNELIIGKCLSVTWPYNQDVLI